MRTLASIADWIVSFVATLGGTAVVLGALFGWLGKRYLDKALAAERHFYASKIEILKGTQEKRVFVYKTQFEVEFKAYRIIWSASAELMDNVARLLTLYQRVDLPEHPGTKAGFRDSADDALQGAITRTHRYAPFIYVEVHECAKDFIVAARREVEAFSGALAAEAMHREDYSPELALREAVEGIAETKNKWLALESAIRERMAVLSVIDA